VLAAACGAPPAPEADALHEAATVAADDQVQLTITHTFLEKVIEDYITEKVLPGLPVTWEAGRQRVEVKRVDDNTVTVDLDLQLTKFPYPTIDADLDLSYVCNWYKPQIGFSSNNVRTSVHFSEGWDAVVPGLAEALDAIGDKIADKAIKANVGSDLTDNIKLPLADFGGFCAKPKVSGKGDMLLVFGPGHECENDDLRSDKCPSDQPLGTGIQYRCINGYWEYIQTICGVCHPGDKRTGKRCPDFTLESWVCNSSYDWNVTNECKNPPPPQGDDR
jgi:hypothetical protein